MKSESQSLSFDIRSVPDNICLQKMPVPNVTIDQVKTERSQIPKFILNLSVSTTPLLVRLPDRYGGSIKNNGGTVLQFTNNLNNGFQDFIDGGDALTLDGDNESYMWLRATAGILPVRIITWGKPM